MTQQRRFNPRSILLLVLGLLLVLNVVRSMRASNGITYSELRELFVQEQHQRQDAAGDEEGRGVLFHVRHGGLIQQHRRSRCLL